MIELLRFGETTQGKEPAETLGALRIVDDEDVIYECRALELPDHDNETGVSRIPEGEYVCEQVDSSPAFDYRHFWIHDEGHHLAAGRSGVKIHVANYVRQLRGCIAPGQEFVDLDGDGLLDVTHSRTTLEDLLSRAPEKTTITIRTLHDEHATSMAPAELETLDADITYPTPGI